MDPLQRRKHIGTNSNPNTRLDYVSTLDGAISIQGGGSVKVTVRYVPDKLIIRPETFIAYLGIFGAIAWPSIEEAAGAILDDLNNEVVPRWVQVTLEYNPDGDSGWTGSHRVMLEDRQPRWNNPTLLARLKQT